MWAEEHTPGWLPGARQSLGGCRLRRCSRALQQQHPQDQQPHARPQPSQEGRVTPQGRFTRCFTLFLSFIEISLT